MYLTFKYLRKSTLECSDVNQYSNTGTKGRDIVHILLQNGADPKAVDANGWDALMIAAVHIQLYSCMFYQHNHYHHHNNNNIYKTVPR